MFGFRISIYQLSPNRIKKERGKYSLFYLVLVGHKVISLYRREEDGEWLANLVLSNWDEGEAEFGAHAGFSSGE